MSVKLGSEHLDAVGRAAGFQNWAEAVYGTATLSVGEAALKLRVPVIQLTRARYQLQIRSLVPTRRVQSVLNTLLERGWTLGAIERVTGLSRSTLITIIRSTKASSRTLGTTYYRLTALLRRPVPDEVGPADELTPKRGGTDPRARIREGAAKAAGYPSWEVAIRESINHPVQDVARELKMSTSTVSTWRRKLDVHQDPALIAALRLRYAPMTWRCALCGETVSDPETHEMHHHRPPLLPPE